MPLLFQDIRYAIRTLSQNPGFTLIVIITLALGIGANVTLFSLVNAILLRPPPVERPEEIVEVFFSDYDGSRYGFSSYLDYVDFRKQNEVFTDLLASAVVPVSINQGTVTIRGDGAVVTDNYFSTLGVKPVPGRGFTSSDGNHAETQLITVLSHGLWQRLFGGAPDIIGQPITLNGQVFTIIGIAPPEFTGMQRGVSVDVWVPIQVEQQLTHAPFSLLDRSSPWLSVLGRLRSGIESQQAQAQLNLIARQLHQIYPEIWTDARQQPRTVSVLPEYETRIPMSLRSEVLDFLAMMVIVVGLVLLIACANVANLMLSRTIGRRQEIAIRLSLGVGRWRLMRQLLTESVLLALAAGGVGLIFALWGTDLLLAFQPVLPVTILLDVSLDSRVIAFTVGIAILTGLLFGAIPALQTSNRDPMPTLKAASYAIVGEATRTARLRSALVIIQIALSLLMLIGAGLFLRSLQAVSAVDVGFDAEDVLLISMDLHQQGYDTASSTTFYTQLLERIQSLRNVSSASLAATLPLGGGPGRTMISIDASTSSASNRADILMNLVGPRYFETMEKNLVQGRGFSDQVKNGQPFQIIINETFARRYISDQNPLNQKIRLDVTGEGPEFTVIGIVKDGKYRTLEENTPPVFYLPILQHVETLHSFQTGVTLLIRTTESPLEMVAVARRVIQSLAPQLPLFNVTTLMDHVSVVYLPVRFGGTILGLFGCLALLIATIGLYGVMSYNIRQRTHEIGVRMALGAQKRDVLRLILGRALVITAVGIGIGLIAAIGVTPFLARYLYGISTTDPLTFAVVTVILTAVSLLASYLPAHRAMQVDPMQILRHE